MIKRDRRNGVTISGTMGDVDGDVVGRDKIELNLTLIENPETSETLRTALEFMQRASSLLEDASAKRRLYAPVGERSPTLSFWIREALDPLHGAMKSVHSIYLTTFGDVERLLDDNDPTSLNVALQLLSRRHLETRETRMELQAFRISIRELDGIPVEIQKYLDACETYFLHATVIAVSSPMRALLEQLSRLDVSALSDQQLKAMDPYEGSRLPTAARTSVCGVIHHLEENWPHVLSRYYSGRLQFLQRGELKNDVEGLLEQLSLLTREQRLGSIRRASTSNASEELGGIEAELDSLTSE